MRPFCPRCRGILRPAKGAMVCINCNRAGSNRRLTQAAALPGVDPTIQPEAATWTPVASGTPHPQLGLFPHDEIRDGQRRMARDVKLAVQGGKLLVAQAPTGIGKTAASLAPALEEALASGKKVVFLTGRQSQHRIAVDTLRRIQEKRGVRFGLVDLVAKRDMCLRPEASSLHPARFPSFCSQEMRSKSCPYVGDVPQALADEAAGRVLHVQELMQLSKGHGLCPHLVAVAAAPRAQVIVADYNHVFSDLRKQSLERLGVKLADTILIVDEAHNLADRIRQSHAHRVTRSLLDRVEGEALAARIPGVEADLEALRRAIAALARALAASGQAQRGPEGAWQARTTIDALHEAFEAERSRSLFSTRRTLEDAAADLAELAKKAAKGTDEPVAADELGGALDDWGRFGAGALRYVRWHDPLDAELHVRLLDPALAARTAFGAVRSAVLMSGTLRPPEMARDMLGLDPGRTSVRVYPSPYPPEHRLVVVAQGLSTRYTDRDEALWARVAGHVNDLAAACKGNVAVFAPSYAIAKAVGAHLQTSKELLTEQPGLTKSDRETILDALRGAKGRGGALLLGVVGGSFAEGVDYPDNLLSAVAVVGLPLAPPELEVEATIEHLERQHPGKGRLYGYVYPAMARVLQAMGRGVRGPTDKCAILLLDERYLVPPYRQLLPEVPVIGSPEPGKAAAAFLAGHGL